MIRLQLLWQSSTSMIISLYLLSTHFTSKLKKILLIHLYRYYIFLYVSKCFEYFLSVPFIDWFSKLKITKSGMLFNLKISNSMYKCSLDITEMNLHWNYNENISVILVIKSHFFKEYHQTALTTKNLGQANWGYWFS